MRRTHRTRPMSLKRLNLLMESLGENYRFEKKGDEIIMVKMENAKQFQPNLFAHLKNE